MGGRWTWPAGGGSGGGGGGGAAAAPVPQLQTNITGNAVAMWSLDCNASTSNYTGMDRSGNMNDLQTVNAEHAFPDIIPGAWAPWMFLSEVPTAGPPHGTQSAAALPALQISGEMSITFRMMKSLYPAGNTFGWSKYEYVVVCGNGDDVTAGGNVQWSVVLNIGGQSGCLTYFAENGVHNPILYVSSLRPNSNGLYNFTDGYWHFVSLRRTAAGVVTLGIDGVYETSGALAPPSGGSTGRVWIGKVSYPTGPGSPDVGLIGSVRDVCVWPVRLTDAQVLTLNKQAMGLP